ncbi:Retrovirus-related Pol polyprotein from type-1 retrotransposable element R1 4 [Eumeta japonica]|uniref:Retrovirus-related Pol polyprotein from type-1 retrotransposable element R1 4 n=1 Tax=Eumeta variegata TaxID=151549 RepID=A0A4C1SH85_EUMVA|nr:Retrovirus-related Pol polyprotein from type-1 retrotransposable element R1 4 [Eumeta japonica]
MLAPARKAACRKKRSAEDSTTNTNTLDEGVHHDEHSGFAYARWGWEVRSEIMQEWQREMEWRSEWTRAVPFLSGGISSDWVEPDYKVSQLLTGHGCFRKRLHDLGLNDTSVCLCGLRNEDMHHVLWCCLLYNELRTVMLSGLEVLSVGPVYYSDFAGSSGNFRQLREFALGWYKLRDGQL